MPQATFSASNCEQQFPLSVVDDNQELLATLSVLGATMGSNCCLGDIHGERALGQKQFWRGEVAPTRIVAAVAQIVAIMSHLVAAVGHMVAAICPMAWCAWWPPRRT